MKLHLPSKLAAAVLAGFAPALFSTLSTASLVAGAACTMAGTAQAAADPAAANAGDTSQTMHVYILTGQSNAQGAVYASPASPAQLEQYQSDAVMWNASLDKYSTTPVFAADNAVWRDVSPQLPIWGGNYSMGGEYGFASMMERLAGDEKVTKANGERLEIGQLAVIKAALNGGGNQYWVKGNAAYEKMLEGMKNALQAAVNNGYQSVSIDGLMYLQGESNDGTGAGLTESRYKEYIANLTGDLSAWVTAQGLNDRISVAFDGNTVLGEPSRNPSGTIEKQIAAATTDGHVNTDDNGIGFVYARDLAKGADNLHYTGESQLSIGARYAYALAVQQGYNVGTVRGSDSTKALDNAGAWWMEQLPDSDAVVKWDVSSVAKTNTIGSSLTVGGIVVEDPYQGQVNISGGTLHVGAQGIELKQGSLNVASAFVADAPQTWKVAGGRTLNLSNAGTISNTIFLINDSGSGTAHVSVNGATQHWNIAGDVALKVGSVHSVSVADGAALGLASVSGSELALDSLSMGADTTLYVGGAGTAGSLSIGSLTLGGHATVNMDFMGSTRYDKLALTAMNGEGTVNFNFNVTKTGRGGSFTVVQGWNGGDFTYSGLETLEGATFAADGKGNLVLTLAGGSGPAVVTDYTKAWPTATPTTAPTITGNGRYSAYGFGSNVLVNSRTSTGELYAFALASAASGTVVGSESDRKDIYAEYRDVPATWVAAVGSNGNGTKLGELYGDVSLKVTGTETFTTTAYAAVNATTVHGDVYMELDNPNVTYNSVNGAYISSIEGSNTIVIKGGKVTGNVTMGSVNGGHRISGGTFLQIEDGTFGGVVAGGNGSGSAVIDNGAHLSISGGTFNNKLVGGNISNATINGGVEMNISGGTFNSEVTGGNNNANSVINGDVHVNISGGTFKNWVLIGGMYNGKTDGDVYLTISGGDFSGSNGIYAGCGSQNYTITGKSSITLQDIAEGNEFAAYTGVLSGQNQATNATAIATRELSFSHVTTGIKANLQNFTSLTVADESDATLYKSTQSALGGVSSVQIQEASALTLVNDNGGPWGLGSITFNLEEGATLKKVGSYWTNIGKLTGEGTFDIAGASNYGSQVANLSEFRGTVHVAAGNSLQLTAAGSANTTFSVDKGGTAALMASADKMGTLSGDGQVVFRGNVTLTTGNNHSAFDFDNWSGIVKIGGADVANASALNLSKLGCAGSVIQLDGVGASNAVYLTHGEENAVSADIHLSGSGLKLSGGYSGKTTIFEGAWTGSGDFTFNHTATQTFRFLGNMTDYAGNISLGGGQGLGFGDGDVSVNLGIAATSDTGKGSISGAGSATAQVKINYLTDSTSSSTLTGNLALTQNGSQVLTVLGHNNYTGATNINNGSIKLEGDGTLGTGTVTMNAANGASLILDGLTINSAGNTTNATISGQGEYGISASGIRGTEAQKVTIANAALTVTGAYVLEHVNMSSSKFLTMSGSDATFTDDVAMTALNLESGSATTFNGAATVSGAVNNSGLITVNDTMTLTGDAATTKNLGQVAGAGTIVASSTNAKRVYNISGDLAEWTGRFEQSAGSGSMTLNIAETDVLNADIINKATTSTDCKLDLNLKQGMAVNGTLLHEDKGELNVTLSGDTVFNNEATLTSLSAAGKTVTLGSRGEGETATHGTLTVSGSTAADTLNITQGSTATLAGSIALATVNLSGNGTLQLLNQEQVQVSELTMLGTDADHAALFGAYQGAGSGTHEASIIVYRLLSANAHAKLNANLVLGQGAALDLDTATGLQMGSSITLNSDHKVTLSDDMYTYLSGLELGERLTLFTGVDSLILDGATYSEGTEVAAALYFTALPELTHPENSLVLSYSGGPDGTITLAVVPEPATATLSLLALAALAARRRRH